MGPPEPPSLELPKPPEDLRASRKGDKVTLTWSVPEQTTDRQRVRFLGNTEICRSLDAAIKIDPIFKKCESPVGESAPPAAFAASSKSSSASKNSSHGKIRASFVARLASELEQEHPTEFVTYAVAVLNKAGRGAGLSNQVRVPLVPTLAPFSDFAARPTDQGILISWRCPQASFKTSDVTYLFRIHRRLDSSSSNAIPVAQVDAAGCAEGAIPDSGKAITSFLDQSFEWEKTYFYYGTVVSVVRVAQKPAVEVEGDDTPEVKVFAHDIFPPAVPSGLQAVFSGPGQQPFIDLIWAPAANADLDGYNIYRREDHAVAVKINPEPVKAPAYRDMRVEPGKTYFYSVTAVDQRGNESGRSEETSESVP